MSMTELRGGIACTLGAFMLESSIGRMRMMDIVFNRHVLPAERAHQLGLLNTIAEPNATLDEAVGLARQMAGLPEVPFRETKQFANRGFREELERAIEGTVKAHAASFASGAQMPHFQRVLGTSSN
jgi:carboxymethylproline synthase